MRFQRIPIFTTAGFLVATGCLFATGCPDETGTNPNCPDGATFSADADACLGGEPADGTNGDTLADGEETDGDGYGNGACEKRSSYLQIRKPNVYFLFDRSASVSGDKMTQAKSGLDQVADDAADRIRSGLAVYPKPSAGCSISEELELGEHSAKEIKQSYAMETAAGGTPTGVALYQVRATDALTDPDDPNEEDREEAVILITDGEPNDQEICGENPRDPFVQARKLREQGASVYVVGFRSDAKEQTLNRIAKEGGTDAPGSNRFYEASDGNQLAQVVLDITDNSIACEFELDPPPPAGSSVNVAVGGDSVPDSDYTFDEASGRVRVEGSSCEKLKNQSIQGTSLTIDVGCPTCKLAGESCQSPDECCDGKCVGGVCKEQCRGPNEECATDGECCSDNCARTEEDENIGQCIGQ